MLEFLREELLQFKGKKIKVANGTVKTIDASQMKGRTLKDIYTFGKHMLFYFGDDLTLRIHYLMFGVFYIDKKRDKEPQLHLVFDNKKVLNFYTTSMRYIERPLAEEYDWRTDIMSNEWDAKYVRKLIKDQLAETMICDLLMDQEIFTGVGNIIKNEALYRTGIHPENEIGKLPPKKLTELMHETLNFSQDFLRWRKVNHLDRNLEVYGKKECPKHGTKLHKENTGTKKRMSFWCETCQKRY